MSITCPDCEVAAVNPRTARFTSHCAECCARSLAQSPSFFDSERDGRMSKTYLAALKFVYRENWQPGHALVKKWAAKIAEAM